MNRRKRPFAANRLRTTGIDAIADVKDLFDKPTLVLFIGRRRQEVILRGRAMKLGIIQKAGGAALLAWRLTFAAACDSNAAAKPIEAEMVVDR